MKAIRAILNGARDIRTLIIALSEAYAAPLHLSTAEMTELGRIASAATRDDAWANAIYLPTNEMHLFACARARRYTTFALLPLWLVDMIQSALKN